MNPVKESFGASDAPSGNAAPALVLDRVSVSFPTPNGPARAVNEVSLTVHQGEIVGLLGESGSGKSTLAFAILRLLQGGARLDSGRILVLGQDLYALPAETLRSFRWQSMAMVFQSAMNALNPVLTVQEHIRDTLLSHEPGLSSAAVQAKVDEVLDLVQIDRGRARAFPHELSGGMKQRVVLAIAMIYNPPILLMDEPTTALDVVVQRSILDRVQAIQRERRMAILFISHDFSLVASLAHRIAIMYAGRLVEVTDSLVSAGLHHPYTEGLIQAIPELTADDVRIQGIPGNPPDLLRLPSGCPFHPRCARVMERCRTVRPDPVTVDGGTVWCHHVAERVKEA